MAKRDFEIKAVENTNSYSVLDTSKEKGTEKEAPHAKGSVSLAKESMGRRIKKAFIADEVTSIKDFAIFDVVIPAIKRTFRDLLVNSLDITLGYGKSAKSPYQTMQSGSKTYVAYGNIGRYADEQPKKDRHDSAIIGPMELDRIKFCDLDDFGNVDLRQSKDSAIEALGYLMDILEDGYDCVTVAQFLSYVSTKVNGIHVNSLHSKWGWYSLQGAAVIECSDGSGYYIRFPKPVPM